jgi:hypothetical protein
MEILSPVWPDRRPLRLPKTRPRSLEGATVALVDDNLDAAFTLHLEALLAERAGAKVRRWVKPSGTAPSPASLLEAAGRDAAAAVVGIGL